MEECFSDIPPFWYSINSIYSTFAIKERFVGKKVLKV